MTYDCLEHYRSHFPRSPKEELPVAFLSRLSATTGGAWQRTFLFKVRGVDLASRQQARLWFDGRSPHSISNLFACNKDGARASSLFESDTAKLERHYYWDAA